VHQTIAFHTATEFYRTQQAQGQLDAAHAILETARTLLQNAQSQYDNGRATLPDVQNAQAGAAEAEDIALVLHTSGTTSRPKIVPLRHINVTASAYHIGEALQLTPDDVCLNIMPLFHIHGLIAAVLSSLAAGASVSCTPGFNAFKFFATYDEVRPTWFTAVPTMHQTLLSLAGRNAELIARGRLRAVRTEAGDIACDRAVIAAGAWSKALARAAGDTVPLETERGYHAVIRDPGFALRHTIMPSDGKMANTMTPQGLRIAGQVEIAGLAAAPNWKRAEILRDFALKTYPALPRDLPADRVSLWMGHRPSMPDSLPCIGPAAGCADVVHCFGHGHTGLAAGPLSGRLAADLIGGKPPTIARAPYAASRFR